MIRLDILIGIDYRSDVKLAMKLVNEVATGHSGVLADPAPVVLFDNFGGNALNIKLHVYLPSIENRLRIRSELHTLLKSKLDESGIEIAFPQRDVHFDTSGPIDIRMHRDSD